MGEMRDKSKNERQKTSARKTMPGTDARSDARNRRKKKSEAKEQTQKNRRKKTDARTNCREKKKSPAEPGLFDLDRRDQFTRGSFVSHLPFTWRASRLLGELRDRM
jgi:hypothetical protein